MKYTIVLILIFFELVLFLCANEPALIKDLIEVPCSSFDQDEKKPNIIFILVDDLGKEWLGCYGGQ
ncbi:MAG: hypothetical protein VXZ83_04315, partial [Verrucomicrobiota bacterium]|nr:hypothetical protein [Verrucomicrobiota bacterium]